MTPKTFVLIHGAWHGGWCWARVARLLCAQGYGVQTPTLSGLGEHADGYHPRINLSTHVQDVVSLLEIEDLEDVILCGHSYGGMVIAGAADRLPDRIAGVVYLDAFVPGPNQSTFDLDLPEFVASHVDRAGDGGGHSVLPIPAEIFGVNPADRAWVDSKMTPQPLACLVERLQISDRPFHANKTYVFADGWKPNPHQRSLDKVRAEDDWTIHELDCGHDVMVDAPERLSEILIQSALAGEYAPIEKG